MKKHANSIKNLILSHKIISAIILFVVLFVCYKVFGANGAKEEIFVVKRGDVIQKVIVNGKTKPVNSVDLGFQTSGTVSRSYVEIGSRVSTGQTLVALDNSELSAQYMKAEANLASEKAKLEELKKGTRPEELAVVETTLANAKVSLSDSQKNLRDKIVDIVGNNIDQLFSNPKSSNPQFSLSLIDAQLKTDLSTERLQIENIINNWNLDNGENNLPIISLFIDNVAKAVNSLTSSSNISQTTIDGYKTSVSTAKSTLITYRDALTSAKSAYVIAQKNYDLKKSGNTPEVISSQEAKVLQADADLQNISAQLGKTILRSPQNGVVTRQDAKVGEVVTSGKVVVSIISDNDLEIESNVSEVSIGKVNVGNNADIKFDAFPGEVFKGRVTYIEPGETIVDGVVNYKVTVAFSEKYPQIKSGLTSKLDIVTGSTTNSLYIPQYSIFTVAGKNFVNKIVGKNVEKVEVSLGLKGQDGSTEILSGLEEGDTVEALAPTK